MEVWVDPKDKRIKAIYRGCTTSSSVWKDRGYVKYDEITPDMLPMTHRPAKPIPNTKLEDLLIDKGLVTKEEIEGLRTVAVKEL